MRPVADDPVARRSPRMARFFTGVMRRQMHGGFRAVRLARPGLPALPQDAPVVVYSNHPSWWDPAFFIVLADACFPGCESYGPMESGALERYGFMKRIGIFGVEPDSSRGALRFLRVGEHVLANPRRMIWMTAQGAFVDPRAPIELRPGLAALMARVPGAVALPLAMEYPFWSERRPEALAAFGRPLPAVEASQAVLEEALRETASGLAARAQARDPDAFERLVGGTAGVGGIYGHWSKLKARLGGEAFQADHLADGDAGTSTR